MKLIYLEFKDLFLVYSIEVDVVDVDVVVGVVDGYGGLQFQLVHNHN